MLRIQKKLSENLCFCFFLSQYRDKWAKFSWLPLFLPQRSNKRWRIAEFQFLEFLNIYLKEYTCWFIQRREKIMPHQKKMIRKGINHLGMNFNLVMLDALEKSNIFLRILFLKRQLIIFASRALNWGILWLFFQVSR